MKKLTSLMCAAFLCASAIPAFAASSEDNQQQREHRRPLPPPEAVEACKGLSANDICQFNGRNNELVSGVCDTPRRAAENSSETATLACRPKRGDRDSAPPKDDNAN